MANELQELRELVRQLQAEKEQRLAEQAMAELKNLLNQQQEQISQLTVHKSS